MPDGHTDELIANLETVSQQISSPPVFSFSVEFGEALLEVVNDAVIVANRDGVIVLVNSRACLLTGYSKNEITGQKVELLIPSASRGNHEKHRTDYIGEPQTRRMGVGIDLFCQTKSGSKVPVDIGLNPIVVREGMFVIAIIRVKR
jgi:protein-histidine pros-kinase